MLPVPLTALRATLTGGPNWSPDGSHIVFDSNKEGQFEVYTVSAAGGEPRRMTNHPATDGVPYWSRDGAWIYFLSTRSGARQLWKLPAGGGEPVQVTRNGGYYALQSADGRYLYYGKTALEPSALWRMPVGGGEETEVLPSVTFLNFDVCADGVYYIPRVTSGASTIHYLSFATGKNAPVHRLTGALNYGLTVSPDGRTVLYTQVDRQSSDLMLVENFR